jgi:dextranase
MHSSYLTVTLQDLYPDLGTYRPGQPINLILELESGEQQSLGFQLMITRAARVVDEQHKEFLLSKGFNRIQWSWQPPEDGTGGYGAEIKSLQLVEEPGISGCSLETAFDILLDWTVFPRYGFMSDFSPDRTDAATTMQALAKYHINGLQFYDWQYRHDCLVPSQDKFIDPLGRLLSLKTILNLLNEAHTHGMAAMPYLAVYAASALFWREHLDWALYDRAGKAIPFGEDFLGLMNPAPGTPWQRHLLDECGRVLTSLPFDGLHVDQYGEPKEVYDHEGRPVNLPDAFKNFVKSAASEHPGKPVLFNAVGNWPIEALAAAPTAFNYIEVWPPDTSYLDLARIVRNARMLSDQKPVVIAVYIPAARIANIRLANAIIHSAGGSRIELGENERLLSDPYFPKHEPLSENLRSVMRRYADFAVRYSEWIGPVVPEMTGINVTAPAGVEIFTRRVADGWSVSLVNLAGLQACHWNEVHDAPQTVETFSITLDIPGDIEQVWLASPDGDSLQTCLVEFIQGSGKIQVKIPRLDIWDVLFLENKKI